MLAYEELMKDPEVLAAFSTKIDQFGEISGVFTSEILALSGSQILDLMSTENCRSSEDDEMESGHAQVMQS